MSSFNGEFVVLFGDDFKVKFWFSEIGEVIVEFVGYEKNVYSVLFYLNGEFLFFGDLVGVVKEWFFVLGELICDIDVFKLYIYNGG